jgi:hypothetical protein
MRAPFSYCKKKIDSNYFFFFFFVAFFFFTTFFFFAAFFFAIVFHLPSILFFYFSIKLFCDNFVEFISLYIIFFQMQVKKVIHRLLSSEKSCLQRNIQIEKFPFSFKLVKKIKNSVRRVI